MSFSAGATYALTQLAHIPTVDEMDFDALLWASTVRAWDEGHHFRKSRYDVWGEDEPEPDASEEDFPTNTVLSKEGGVSSPFDFTDETDDSDESRFTFCEYE